MTSGIEKRRHVRLSAMGPVEVVVQGGSPEVAYLASIGRGGLGQDYTGGILGATVAEEGGGGWVALTGPRR